MIRRHIVKGYDRAKAFYEKYEAAFMPTMLLLGTVFDAITFRTLSIETTFTLQAAYLVIAGACLVYSHVYDGREWAVKGKVLGYLRVAVQPVIQFTFGALLSNALVFYWFSGAASVSWPVLGMLAALMASNELFRKFFLRPVVQVGVYAYIVFSFTTLLFPFLFNSLSVWTFLSAGAASLVAMFCFIALVAKMTPIVRNDRTKMSAASVTVFVAMTALYFANVIPPIPLSLRDAGAYYRVGTDGGEYVREGEDESWLDRLLPGQTLSLAESNRIYVYTAIFAPADLTTRIYHEWQYYDEADGAWDVRDRLSFGISGGRDEGFRGYSFKTSLTAGKWRVSVETERGQVLGVVPFTLVTEPIE